MTEVIYPWPPKELSPNARTHWSVKAREAKKLKNASWALTMAARPDISHQSAHLSVEFRPPSRRRIDLDNCIARFKAGFDGIASAIGIDDSKFTITAFIGQPITGGGVRVVITEGGK